VKRAPSNEHGFAQGIMQLHEEALPKNVNSQQPTDERKGHTAQKSMM
jgi:hypothetical protein